MFDNASRRRHHAEFQPSVPAAGHRSGRLPSCILCGFPRRSSTSVVSCCPQGVRFVFVGDGVSARAVCLRRPIATASAYRSIGFRTDAQGVSRISNEGRKVRRISRPRSSPSVPPNRRHHHFPGNTLFAMRLANERDAALGFRLSPDARRNLLSFVSLLGTRESLRSARRALPTRLRFIGSALASLPRSEATIARFRRSGPPRGPATTCIASAPVLERWRGALRANATFPTIPPQRPASPTHGGGADAAAIRWSRSRPLFAAAKSRSLNVWRRGFPAHVLAAAPARYCRSVHLTNALSPQCP